MRLPRDLSGSDLAQALRKFGYSITRQAWQSRSAPLTVRPEGLTGTRLLASLLVSPATMWLLLAVVGVANLWQLSRQPLSCR